MIKENTQSHSFDSPIGRIRIFYIPRPFVLVRVQLPGDTENDNIQETLPLQAGPGGRVRLFFDGYFDKRPIPPPWELLKLDGYTSLQQKVWRSLSDIPFGKVTTYSGLAAAVGRPQASRFIGTTMGRNPFPILIPCHRVVRADGGLGGFTGGIGLKQRLLAFEGSFHLHSK